MRIINGSDVGLPTQIVIQNNAGVTQLTIQKSLIVSVNGEYKTGIPSPPAQYSTTATVTIFYTTTVSQTPVPYPVVLQQITNQSSWTISQVGVDKAVADILGWKNSSVTSGTVTSVGLTAPPAFNVSGSPITTAGVIAITGAGTTAQYIRGDGTLATLPTSTGTVTSVAFANPSGTAFTVTGSPITTSGTFNLVASNTTAGFVLSNNGSGVLSWVVNGSGAPPALTATYIGYGSGGGTLTGDANWIRNGFSVNIQDASARVNMFMGTPSQPAGNGALTGIANMGFGQGALNSLTTGQYNAGFGIYTLTSDTTGSQNTAVGSNSGATNVTGSQNVFLGNATDVNVDGWSNSVALGTGALITASNQLVLGNGITTWLTNGGSWTIPTSNSAGVLTNNGSGVLTWGSASSGTVTSVALTMPSAFSVGGSPITTAGTLAVTGSGTTSQYIDGTGALQTFPTLPTGTVTNFSAGNLSPLFTTSVATSTTTPALTFNLGNAIAYNIYGNNSGSTGIPAFFSPALASGLFQNQGTATTLLHGNAAGNPSWGAIVTGDIATNAVTYAKMQQASATTLLGNPTGSLANVSEITLGRGMSFSGTTLVGTGILVPFYGGGGSFNPAISTTYYFGNSPQYAVMGVSTTGFALAAPITGKIYTLNVIAINHNATSSSEVSTLTLTNNTASTSVTITSALTLNANFNTVVTLGTPFAVTAGDLIDIKWITPAWVTPPQGTCISIFAFMY